MIRLYDCVFTFLWHLEKRLHFVRAIFASITLCLAWVIVPRSVKATPKRLPCFDGLISLQLVIIGVGLIIAVDIIWNFDVFV